MNEICNYSYQFSFLDSFEDLVFVYKPEDRTVVFINKAASTFLGLNQQEINDGFYQIESLFAQYKHVSIDKIKNLDVGTQYTWSFYDKKNAVHFNIKNSIIYCDHHKYILEVVNVVDPKHQNTIPHHSHNITIADNELLIEKISNYISPNKSNFKNSITKILGILAQAFKANRAVAFINLSVEKNNFVKYEWFDQNCTESYFDDFFSSDMFKDYTKFADTKPSNFFYCSEITVLFPDIYKRLTRLGTKSIIAVGLKINNETVGVINIHNPNPLAIKKYSKTMYFICLSISSLIYNLLHFDYAHQLSYIDGQTKLLNHKAYLNELNKNLNSDIGIIIVDINDLYNINHTSGKERGDFAIHRTVQILKNIQEEYKIKSYVYRTAGSAFVFLIRNIDKKTFDTIVATLNATFNSIQEFSCSIGYDYHDDADSKIAHEVANNAEINLNNEKREFYRNNPNTPKYLKEDDEYLSVISSLKSLQKLVDTNCFYPVVQPVYDAKTEKVTYAEALIRLKIGGEQLPPSKFMPLIEDLNLSYVIDFFVFREICKFQVSMLGQNIKIVPIATNFSRYTIERDDFIESITNIIELYNLPKKYIALEITESVLGKNYDLIIERTKTLSKLGFKLSLDDFGVTNSNLFSLSQFSLNNLKLDKSLIDLILPNAKMKSIIKLFIEIAKDQNLATVAEGVETKEQFEVLKELGCDMIQGYYFSKPLNLFDFKKLLQS